MSCDSIKEILSAYVDGEVTCEEEQECLKHLETCDECQEALSMLMEIKNNIDVIDSIDLPSKFHEDLMGRIEQEATVGIDKQTEDNDEQIIPFKKKTRYKWMGYIASVAAVFAGAIMIVGPEEGSVQQEQIQQESTVRSTTKSVPKATGEEMEISPMSLAPQGEEQQSQQQVHLQVQVSNLEQGVEAIQSWAKENEAQVTIQQKELESVIELMQVEDYEQFKEELLQVDNVVAITVVSEYIEGIVALKLYTE